MVAMVFRYTYFYYFTIHVLDNCFTYIISCSC